jgi:signal transduction histidine kinase
MGRSFSLPGRSPEPPPPPSVPMVERSALVAETARADRWRALAQQIATLPHGGRDVEGAICAAACAGLDAHAAVLELPVPGAAAPRRFAVGAPQASRRLLASVAGEDGHEAVTERSESVVTAIVALDDSDATLHVLLPAGATADAEELLGALADAASRALAASRLAGKAVVHEHSLRQMADRLHRFRRITREIPALVSHQVRTPITSILGYLELLQSGRAGDLNDRQQSFVHKADANSRRLLRLLDDLLLVVELQSGAVPAADSCDVARVVREAVRACEADAAGHGLRLVLGDTPIVLEQFEPRRLQRTFEQLIEEAMAASEAGSDVRVTVRKHEDAFTVSVRHRVGVDAPPQPVDPLAALLAGGSPFEGTGGATQLGIASFVIEQYRGSLVRHALGDRWVITDATFPRLSLADQPADGRPADAVTPLVGDVRGRETIAGVQQDRWAA